MPWRLSTSLERVVLVKAWLWKEGGGEEGAYRPVDAVKRRPKEAVKEKAGVREICRAE
jgi:hypothetical protein